MTGAFQATAFQSTAFQVEAAAVEIPSGGGAGGGSRAYRKRLREAAERRQRFEEEHWRRIAAIGVERPELEPAPETVAMLAEVHAEVEREIEDSEEEELLLLLLAA
jgi:hypothetical protein